ncbi:NAD-dependent epimerase/dehydratase family protein, partial [Roseateles sp. GG27B]
VAMGCVLNQRPLRVFGDGQTVRDYIYIDDVVNAMLRATVAVPAVLNISSGLGRTVNDVIAAVETASGQRIERQRVPERSGDVGIS